MSVSHRPQTMSHKAISPSDVIVLIIRASTTYDVYAMMKLGDNAFVRI